MQLQQLLPRLSEDEVRSLAVWHQKGQTEPPFPLWVSQDTLALYIRMTETQAQFWGGLVYWPDGMVGLMPVLTPGDQLNDILSETYWSRRHAAERHVLDDCPVEGQA